MKGKDLKLTDAEITEAGRLFMETGEWFEYILPEGYHPGWCAECGEVLGDGCKNPSCKFFKGED